MIARIEKILSLLQAEGINPYDEEIAIKSLTETVMPKQNIESYMKWINDRKKEKARLW